MLTPVHSTTKGVPLKRLPLLYWHGMCLAAVTKPIRSYLVAGRTSDATCTYPGYTITSIIFGFIQGVQHFGLHANTPVVGKVRRGRKNFTTSHKLLEFPTGRRSTTRLLRVPFHAERGTTQGDIISPTIFNIVVDAVVRTWFHRLETEGLAEKVQVIFNADDGYLYSHNADALQRSTEKIVDLFECMGLKTNPNKTKVMTYAPQPAHTRICTPAYKRRMGDLDTDTYSARKRQIIECDICNANVQE
jgi:hypothetical protein